MVKPEENLDNIMMIRQAIVEYVCKEEGMISLEVVLYQRWPWSMNYRHLQV
jgi:hypothetical protein